MESIRNWVENSPYTRALGARLEAVESGADTTTARIALPFMEENSNPGQALHGGCAASLAAVGGQCVARAAMGEETGPWHTSAVQVNYLAAAIGDRQRAETDTAAAETAAVATSISLPSKLLTGFVNWRSGGRSSIEPMMDLSTSATSADIAIHG